MKALHCPVIPSPIGNHRLNFEYQNRRLFGQKNGRTGQADDVEIVVAVNAGP